MPASFGSLSTTREGARFSYFPIARILRIEKKILLLTLSSVLG